MHDKPNRVEWRLFVCSSCDQDDPYRYLQPMSADADVFSASGDLDTCPRCGEYLPFTPAGIGELVVIQRTKGYGDIPVAANGTVL